MIFRNSAVAEKCRDFPGDEIGGSVKDLALQFVRVKGEPQLSFNSGTLCMLFPHRPFSRTVLSCSSCPPVARLSASR